MSTETKGRKLRRLKGSVLFTTLVVMVLILLIMLAAIGLAGAASKKAYSTWYDNQTKYTAQDVVDSVIETLGPTGTHKDLGNNIIGKLKNKGDKVTVDVKVGGDNYIPGYGEVQPITFEYVADNRSDFTITGLSGHDTDKIIKISTAVSMGGETSTYSTYAVGNKLSNTTEGNSGGFVSFGGYDVLSQPRTVGRVYLGIEDKISKMSGDNEPVLAGDIFFNTDDCNFRMQGSDGRLVLGRNDPMHGYYGGMRVAGNFKAELGVGVTSQYPPSYITDMSAENFYNIPYFYVDGTMSIGGGDGFRVLGDGMLNVYCDKLICTSHTFLGGKANIMMMGEGSDADNKIIHNGSALTDWAKETISNKPSNPGDRMKSGSLYCKGNLDVSGNNSFTVNGDFCVVGNLTVPSGKIEVHNGDVYIGGTLSDADKAKIIVDAGRKIEKLPGVSNSSTYLQALRNLSTTDHPNAAAIADRFDTAFKLKDGDIEYIQTLDNIKRQFIDETGGVKKYAGVVETSKNASSDVWDGSSTIESSCIWNSTSNLSSSSERSVTIDPKGHEIWIDIDTDVTEINMLNIIIDDTNPNSSVNFFIKKNGASQNLKFNKTKIMTKTYQDLLNGSGTLTLNTYPGYPYVPHVRFYASTDTAVNISAENECLFTCDIIAPSAKFSSNSASTYTKTIDYTYYNLVDIDGNGTIESTEQANKVTVNRPGTKIGLIGSLQVKQIAVNNEFGYIYVDDPPTDSGDPGDTDVFSWTTVDGYSTY